MLSLGGGISVNWEPVALLSLLFLSLSEKEQKKIRNCVLYKYKYRLPRTVGSTKPPTHPSVCCLLSLRDQDDATNEISFISFSFCCSLLARSRTISCSLLYYYYTRT